MTIKKPAMQTPNCAPVCSNLQQIPSNRSLPSPSLANNIPANDFTALRFIRQKILPLRGQTTWLNILLAENWVGLATSSRIEIKT